MFLASAQGSAALQALARTLKVTGDALSRVFAAALRQVGPLMVALAPVVQLLAAQLAGYLVVAIDKLGPLLTRLAEQLAAHPALLLALAKAAVAVTVGFGPAAAVLGVVAGLLKGLLLARIVGAAMTQLGLGGTVASRVLLALVSPMQLLREAGPLVARGLGMLAAQLGIMAGPIGALIVLFATLYASSSQFRDAANGVGRVLQGLFIQSLQQAGSIISTTVGLIQRLVGAVGTALSGVADFGHGVAAAFGPAGRFVEDVLKGMFAQLGNIPGAVMTAYLAFRVFSVVAPLFATASAAVAGFSARLIAFQGASGLATAAANATGAVVGKASGAISAMGKALPIVGVALIALGAVFDQFGPKADEMAQKVVAGSLSMQQAIQQEADRTASRVIGWDRAAIAADSYAAAQKSVTDEVQKSLAAMSPMQRLQAEAAMAQANLNDAVAQYGPKSSQAQAASAAYATANGKLAKAQKDAADAAKTHEQRIKELADTMSSQIDAALAYAQAVARVKEAQKDADQALKDNGANSDEYKSKVLDLAQAMSAQADAARRQAEALGGTDAGVQAYNTEILKTANLSTKAGRDAFTQLVAGMDNAGLAALSAAAKTSGLRTEVMKLPDGRTVTVVVAADQGKLPEVKKAVDDLATKPYIGKVTILGDTELAHGAILQTVALADGTTATIKISGDGSPAILTVGQTKYQIDSTTGTIKVLGNVAPGEADLSGLKVKVDKTTGQMTIVATDAPAEQTRAALKSRVDTSIGTITITGNPTEADGKTTQAVRFADGSRGTITVDGNQTPANGKINATVHYADGSTGTIKVAARDFGANAYIDWLARPRTSTITVTTVYGGSYGAADVRAAHGGATGGIVAAMRGGAVVGMAAGGQVGVALTPMRGDIAQVVAPNTWRVIGDRVRDDEFFLPDDNAPRSISIGTEWARRRGFSLIPTRDIVTGRRFAGGGIVAEDGSTVNTAFYSRISPQLRAKQDGRGIARGEIAAASWARLLTLGWREVGNRLYYPGTGPKTTTRPAAPAPPRPAAAASSGQASLAPVVAALQRHLAEFRELRATISAGGAYDAAIAAATRETAANTRGGGPAATASSARYRSALGALA